MAYYSWGGNPDRTSGYVGGGVTVSQNSLSCPTGNLNDGGARPIYISAPRAVYQDRGVAQIWYQGVLTQATYIYPSSGGAFDFRLVNNTGSNMYYGRNTAFGWQIFENGAPGFTGALCGGFDYAFTPWACQSQSLSRAGRTLTLNFAGPASNGDSAITNYICQLWDGVSWGQQQSNVSGTVSWPSQAPGKTYQARVLAQNGVGNSEWVYTGNVFIPPTGKRHDGSSFVGMSLGRRMTAPDAYVEQTIGKRYNGSAWVDFA